MRQHEHLTIDQANAVTLMLNVERAMQDISGITCSTGRSSNTSRRSRQAGQRWTQAAPRGSGTTARAACPTLRGRQRGSGVAGARWPHVERHPSAPRSCMLPRPRSARRLAHGPCPGFSLKVGAPVDSSAEDSRCSVWVLARGSARKPCGAAAILQHRADSTARRGCFASAFGQAMAALRAGCGSSGNCGGLHS